MHILIDNATFVIVFQVLFLSLPAQSDAGICFFSVKLGTDPLITDSRELVIQINQRHDLSLPRRNAGLLEQIFKDMAAFTARQRNFFAAASKSHDYMGIQPALAQYAGR